MGNGFEFQGTKGASRPFVAILIILCLALFLAATMFVVNETEFGHNKASRFPLGAPIVYTHRELSTRPLPNATAVYPAPRGDFYYCTVRDYLRVVDVFTDGSCIGVNRQQQRRYFQAEDIELRRARLSERLIFRSQFPGA